MSMPLIISLIIAGFYNLLDSIGMSGLGGDVFLGFDFLHKYLALKMD
ncbi:hypothetical protein [Methanobrevibacter sp.]|nr:hypothetical protein [Methanobrevibacter sp.]MDO5823661.1 hypothetical protein [Methanobrevibacter sp.]